MTEYRPENVFIGNKIKAYRLKNKWSQLRLAQSVNLKGNTISAYEMGRITIPHSQLVAIAKSLDINHVELLPPEDTPVDNVMVEYVTQAKSKLQPNELEFLEKLIAKTISLNEDEREHFLKNIKFAFDYFEQQ